MCTGVPHKKGFFSFSSSNDPQFSYTCPDIRSRTLIKISFAIMTKRGVLSSRATPRSSIVCLQEWYFKVVPWRLHIHMVNAHGRCIWISWCLTECSIRYSQLIFPQATSNRAFHPVNSVARSRVNLGPVLSLEAKGDHVDQAIRLQKHSLYFWTKPSRQAGRHWRIISSWKWSMLSILCAMDHMMSRIQGFSLR